MAWIGLCDHSEQRFSKSGLGCDAGRASTSKTADDGLLVRGSIVIESQLASDGRPLQLLTYQRSYPWVCGMSVQSIPGGGIVLVITMGDAQIHATATLDGVGAGETLRITYSWDGPARWARLALERVGTDQVALVEIDAPKPFPMADLIRMFTLPEARQMDGHVRFVALSTEIEPVGPMPALTAHVPIETPCGLREVCTLQRGDLVRTLSGDTVPVLQLVRRIVPARGSFRPVRLRAPYFGLRADIVVAPDKRLVIGGSEVEYTYGRERVLVPSRHLVNQISAMHISSGPTVTYYDVILPGHEAILAVGVPMESLYIGRIRRKRAPLMASLLAEFDRNLLPEHAPSPYPVLRPFEAITLAERRAA